MALSEAKKKNIGWKICPENLYLEWYDYSMWSENKEVLTDKEESTDKQE